MKIIRVLEQDGEIYRIGDMVRVTYNDDFHDEGIIDFFGLALDGETGHSDNYLKFGNHIEKLSDIIAIEKLK